VRLGVDVIDTAEAYGPRVSEHLIAEALYPYPAGLVIATKGGVSRSGPTPPIPAALMSANFIGDEALGDGGSRRVGHIDVEVDEAAAAREHAGRRVEVHAVRGREIRHR